MDILIKALRVKLNQGARSVPDPHTAVLKDFRGRPSVDSTRPCPASCSACASACPTQAITVNPVRIDLGLCIFCDDCVQACPEKKLSFTPEFHMAAARREDLVLSENVMGTPPLLSPVAVSAEIKRVFGRSLKLRSVSAGGCNACELELNALSNVNFDIGRYGIEIVASPRHADALVLSGPLTRNMAEAVELAYAAMPEPRFIIATGACTISGGLYAAAPGVDRLFLDRFKPSLYVPGCPPHPLTFISGLLELLGRA